MKFLKRSPYYAESECGGYTINRSFGPAGCGSYMAVKNAGSSIIGVHRFSNEDERAKAYKQAVKDCEGDQRGK